MKFSGAMLFGGITVAAIGSWFAPIWQFLLFTGVVVICDTITGIIAAHNRGEKINSKAFGRTITKMIQYFIAIILAHYVETLFVAEVLDSSDKIVWLVAGMIATKEVLSVYENIAGSTGLDLTQIIRRILPNKEKPE